MLSKYNVDYAGSGALNGKIKKLRNKWRIPNDMINIYQAGQSILQSLENHFADYSDTLDIHLLDKYVSKTGFGYARINYNQFGLPRFTEAFIVQEKSDFYVLTERLRPPSKILQPASDETQSPDLKSPSNILNAMNDDCIQEIFRRLSLFDLCSVANVCNKFKQNADEIFTLKFNQSMVKLDELHVAEYLLRTFGTKIKSLSLDAMHKNALLLILITYCSGSKCQLERLHISNYNHDDLKLWFNMLWPIFQRLKYLKCFGNDNILKFCHNLHHLEIDGNGYALTSSTLNTIRMLENLSIRHSSSNIINKMKPNSSLKVLALNVLDSQTINKISWKFSNLEEINCDNLIVDQNQTTPFASALVRLKKLIKFGWNAYYQCDVNIFIGYLSKANVSIEWLILRSCDLSSTGIKLNIIGILPTLRVLEIVNMRQFVATSLAGCLPQLKELRFVDSSYTGKQALHKTSIIEIIKYSKQMTFLLIDHSVNDLIIDDEFYDELLMIIEQRKIKDKLTIEFRTLYRNIKMIISRGKIMRNVNLLDIQINRPPVGNITSDSVPKYEICPNRL